MADDQQMPVATDAVAEPAAAPAEPQVAAPVSDAAPQEPAPQPDAAPEPTTPEPDLRAELDDLRQRLEAEQPKLQEYEQLREQQQQAAERARIEEAQRRFDEQISDISRRVLAVDTEDEGKQLLADFTRRLLTGVQQSTQQHISQLTQQHQQALEQERTTLQQQLFDNFRPGFADKTITEFGLPNVPEVRNTLMQAEHPDQMPAIAQAIQAILAQTQPQVQQQVAAQHADDRRAANVDAIGGIGGGPTPREPMKAMSATSPESLAILGQIINGQ